MDQLLVIQTVIFQINKNCNSIIVINYEPTAIPYGTGKVMVQVTRELRGNGRGEEVTGV
jgi:hypothetical protein